MKHQNEARLISFNLSNEKICGKPKINIFNSETEDEQEECEKQDDFLKNLP